MLKTIAAIWCGKIILAATKMLGKGGGTAAPGLYALKLDQELVTYFAQQLKNGSVVITGTNGKTTTSRLISHYFSQQSSPYIHNRAGSNLERGIVSACIQECSSNGQLSSDYGVWELDEAAFTTIVNKIKPRQIVLLNLFRDQLDRYGEVDATKNKWLAALSETDYETTVIYNGDDPQLVHLAQLLKKNNYRIAFVAFSLIPHNEKLRENNLLSPMELSLCPQCRNKLDMHQTIIGLGTFSCTNCGLSNPENTIHITDWSLTDTGCKGTIVIGDHSHTFSSYFPGTFNIYNFLAATAYIHTAELEVQRFITKAQEFKPAFARMEKVTFNNTDYILTLIKNPTGFTESLRTLFSTAPKYRHAIFMLNDNYADGLDVSWIWDVNLAKYLPPDIEVVTVAGSRAYDMAVRIHYAGVPKNKIQIIENSKDIFKKTSGVDAAIPVLATYTASLQIQNILEKIGVKNKYWKE